MRRGLVPSALAAVLACAPPACRDEPQRTELSVAPAEPTRPAPRVVPKYDDEGIRLPADELPMGTPVPLGMSEVATGAGWVRFSGQVEPEEVVEFYRKYLTLPEGTAPHEKGRSILFRQARPRQPGNPGRRVEVRVIPEQAGWRTAVLILDRDLAERRDDRDLSGVKHLTPEQWEPSEPGEVPPDELL
jgi:hypothetical protein